MAFRKRLPPAPDYDDLPAWAQDSDQVHRRLVNAAWDALHRRDCEQISVRELAHGIGVSGPAAYNHFKDRDDLFGDVVVGALATLAFEICELWPETEPPGKGTLLGLCRVWLRYAEARPRHYALMFSNRFINAKKYPRAVEKRENLRGLVALIAGAEVGFDLEPQARTLVFALLHGAGSLLAGGLHAPSAKELAHAIEALPLKPPRQ